MLCAKATRHPIRKAPKGPTHVSIMHIRAAGRLHWTHQRDASRWPAGMQACLGIHGGPIFSGAAPNDGAEMDRSRVGRCVTLRDEFCRILRDRFLAAKGNRSRNRIFGEIHMVAAFGKSCGRFLGRRSSGALLDQQRFSVPVLEIKHSLQQAHHRRSHISLTKTWCPARGRPQAQMHARRRPRPECRCRSCRR